MINVSKLFEFWQWWASELIDILPNSKNLSLNHESDMQLYIARKKSKLELRGHNISIEDNGKFISDNIFNKYISSVDGIKNYSAESCDLYIDKGILLARTITLPLATEENIADVVAYEIDRYTPFKKEDVYFDVEIVSKDRVENKLTSVVTVIKKNILDEVLEFCEQTDVVLNNVYAQSENGEKFELTLKGLPDNGFNKKKRSSNKYWFIFALVLLIIAFRSLKSKPSLKKCLLRPRDWILRPMPWPILLIWKMLNYCMSPSCFPQALNS